MTSKPSKTQTSFLRRLLAAYLIDNDFKEKIQDTQEKIQDTHAGFPHVIYAVISNISG